MVTAGMVYSLAGVVRRPWGQPALLHCKAYAKGGVPIHSSFRRIRLIFQPIAALDCGGIGSLAAQRQI
jgi:hypothetical protein